jgi:hypothetical protein
MSPELETPAEIAHLVEVYHRHGIHRRDEDFWAWERVSDIVRGPNVERAFALVLALVRAAPDDRLEHVGAGPVEDLVQHHSATLIDKIEAEARRDPRFREALGSIWLVAEEVSPLVLARLQEVTGGTILVATEAELDAAERRYWEERQSDRDA